MWALLRPPRFGGAKSRKRSRRLDIAKSVFQVHGIDAEGNVILRRQPQAALRLGIPPEAATVPSRYRSLRCRAQALGHTVRLMPPAYVKPYVKRHKNDATDAEAIAAKRSISSLEIPSLVGYPSCQVINSGEECSQNWGCVRLVISDDQIDGRRLAFEGTAGHGPR
jgi:hypothetical protein